MRIKYTVTAAVAALLVTTSANAQIFGDTYGTDLDYDRFNTGFGESGIYDAWDRDDEIGLSESEFGTGVFSDWDRDNDMLISEEEYGLGAGRWYGADYDGVFADYDTDATGYLEPAEFGASWDNDYYTAWDTDGDGLLSEDEYSTGLYNTSDVDQNMVITVGEEGWFDGDDVETEIEQVGNVF